MIERHEEWSDLAPMYVLGGLEAEEVAAFEAHMATCEPCRQEVRELQEVTGFLPLAAEPVAPPQACEHVCWATCSDMCRRAPRRSQRLLLQSLKAPVVLQEDLRRSPGQACRR